MAYFHTNKASSAPVGLVSSLFAALRNSLSAWREARQRMAQYHALNRYSDNDLAQIGLTRGDVIAFVFHDKA